MLSRNLTGTPNAIFSLGGEMTSFYAYGEIVMKGIKKSGLILAGAAAALLASGFVATASAADAPMVKCLGTNACKGKSECKSKDNACKGQNACKGKGWMSMKSADECTKAGGKVAE